MKRHEADLISAGFGVLFALLGVGFLAGNLEWESVNVAALWAVGLLAIGIAVLGAAIHRIRIPEDQDEPHRGDVTAR